MAKRSSFGAFRVCYGEESFFLDREMETARQTPDCWIVQLDGTEVKDYEVVAACETNSMEGARSVVILDDAQKVKGKILEEYVEEKVPETTSSMLLAIVRSDKLSEVWNAAAAKGTYVEYKKLKTWEGKNNEVVPWIREEAKARGLVMPQEMVALLYDRVGNDLYRLSSELRKIAVLAGPGGTVTKSHMLAVVSAVTFTSNQVVDAALSKNPIEALSRFTILCHAEGDGALLQTSSSLMRTLEKAYVAHSMLDKGEDEESIASRLGMNSWRCKQFFLPDVKKHTTKGLGKAMKRLTLLDQDLKGAANAKRNLVELFILSVAE